MSHIIGLLIGLLLLGGMGGRAFAEMPLAPGLSDESVRVLGRERHFKLYVPAAYYATGPLPLVLAFHGYHTKPADLMRTTAFNQLADKAGFMLAYPEGGDNKGWNGEAASQDTSTPQSQEDLWFVDALLEKLEASGHLDTHRLYAVGISSGGFFVQRLACRRADTFAAFATVAATMGMPLSQSCQPAEPVSILMIQGDRDPVVTYGGHIRRIHFIFPDVRILSFPDAVNFWIKHDDCSTQTNSRRLPSRVEDHTAVSEQAGSACRQNTTVAALTIQGGGHTWPNQPGDSWWQRLLIGRVSHNLDATSVIWSFFQSHSR